MRGASVSANFFELMRSSVARGRGFSADEEQQGRDLVVVIGHNLWQRRFGGDPNIVEQRLSLDGQSYNIIGVMPAGFQFPNKAELWKPLVADVQVRGNRGIFWLPVIGRLKPGVTRTQAQAEMDGIARRLEQQYPDVNRGVGVNVVSMHEQLVVKIRPALLVLLGAVVCVLLIASANVANLLLARGAARQKEIAIRAALGAGRWRVAQQLLIENSLLALLGGALGLLVARLGVGALVVFGPRDLPRAESIGIDARVLLFTFGLSLVTGVVFGSFPALQASKLRLTEALKEGGRSGVGLSDQRTLAALVITEIALALLLLLGAGLLLKSSWRLQQVNPGFNSERALKLRLSLPQSKYREGADIAMFYQRLIERLNALPGVLAAGVTSSVLMGKAHPSSGFAIEGRPRPNGSLPELPIDSISPGYFQSMAMQIVQGRAFTGQDRSDGPPVAVVNETMARRSWPSEDPIGKRFTFDDPGPEARWLTVVGVVRDSKRQGLDMGVRIECFVLKLIVKQGMLLALIGLVVGLLAAFALTRLMESLLFGASVTDPLTFALITLLLTFVAFLACWIPARRATKVDPMVALRIW